MKKRGKIRKKEKGITLIALVITVVVLIILAMVSVAMLTGPNGIINKSREAQIENRRGEIKDKVQLEVQGSWDYEEQKPNMEVLKENIVNNLGVDENTIKDTEEGGIEFILDGFNVKVSANGEVSVEGEGAEEYLGAEPKIELTIESDAVFQNSNIQAAVKQLEGGKNIDFSKSKYKYCNTAEPLGTDPNSYDKTFSGGEEKALNIVAKDVGTYYLHVLAIDEKNRAVEAISAPINVVSNAPINYAYRGSPETYTAPADGEYKLEVWGAQGGGVQNNSSADSQEGGLGGYSYGNIKLVKGNNLYVYVGEMGKTNVNDAQKAEGGYNGGGSAWGSGAGEPANGGGGATDIRMVSGSWNDSSSLLSRIIVAGGGRRSRRR